MNKQQIVIIGMGTLGANFSDTLLRAQPQSVRLCYLPELEDRYGQERAQELRLHPLKINELDNSETEFILFDFSQDAKQKEKVLEHLSAKQKQLIVHQKLAQFIWGLISKDRITAEDIANVAI